MKPIEKLTVKQAEFNELDNKCLEALIYRILTKQDELIDRVNKMGEIIDEYFNPNENIAFQDY